MGILTAWFIFIRFCCFLIKKKILHLLKKITALVWLLGSWGLGTLGRGWGERAALMEGSLAEAG